MRFMIIRKADANTEANAMPSKELFAAMMQYNRELQEAGMFVLGEGLHPSAEGARVIFSGGKPSVVDGPFAETKELIAGYTMVEAKSLAQVIEWAKRWPALDGDANVQLEIRQVGCSTEDFGGELPLELKENA